MGQPVAWPYDLAREVDRATVALHSVARRILLSFVQMVVVMVECAAHQTAALSRPMHCLSLQPSGRPVSAHACSRRGRLVQVVLRNDEGPWRSRLGRARSLLLL